MEIQKSGIEIEKPKEIKEEGVDLDDEQNDILQKHFVSLVVGPPGMGKSHYLSQFIKNPKLYYRKFNKILFCCPCKIDGLTNIMTPSNWSINFNIAWIKERLASYNLQNKMEQPPQRVNVLLVLDDVIGEIAKMKTDPEVISLFYNRRHWVQNGVISIIITTQKYVLFPSVLRSVLTNVILFKPAPLDWERIKKETNVCDPKKMDTVARIAFHTKHNFLYIRLDNYKLYINFDFVKI